MAIPGVLRKGGAIAGPKHRFTSIFDKDQFALEDIDELLLVRVPLPWLDQQPGGRLVSFTPKSVSPPARPRRFRTRPTQGSLNGFG
jgi:hypothetical protein